MPLKNILIADAGGTKTVWALTTSKNNERIFTGGISPYFQDSEEINKLLREELICNIGKPEKIDEIYFYGSGCMNTANNNIIKKGLVPSFVNAKIFVNDDVYGAARSLCGNEKGIACILGTGSSACYFNGKKIKEDRTGMGFILGDEGSGAYLGKKVLQHFLYKKFDKELEDQFNADFQTTVDEILEEVYKGKFANKYIASFTPFLKRHRGHKTIEKILEEGIGDFFRESVLPIRHSSRYPIGFVGGIAFNFRDVLKKNCNSFGLRLGKVISQPMDGLLSYHKK